MTEKEKLAIQLYSQGYSVKNVADMIGYKSWSSIINILKKHGIKIRTKAGFKNHGLKHDYFTTIDNENKAYFLGLLLADGNIFNRENSQPLIRLELQLSDEHIFHTLKNDLNTENKIEYTKRNSVSLRWHSEIMANDLKKYSIFPNKTGNKFFPHNEIQEELMHHFIRGFFDGNGCYVLTSSNGKPNARRHITFSDNNVLLEGLKIYLHDKLNLNKVNVFDRPDNCSMLVYASKNDVNILIEYLYRDASIYLIRKYNKIHGNTEVSH